MRSSANGLEKACDCRKLIQSMLKNGQINLAIGKDSRHGLAWFGLGCQGQWPALLCLEPGITSAQHQLGVEQSQAQLCLFHTVLRSPRELGDRRLPTRLALCQLVRLALQRLTRRRTQTLGPHPQIGPLLAHSLGGTTQSLLHFVQALSALIQCVPSGLRKSLAQE